MEKFYMYEGTLVEFSGTAKEHKRFLENNEHLTGTEISGNEVEAAKKKQKEKKFAKEAKEVNVKYLYEAVDLLMNWASTENEISLPEELVSFSRAWQGRKPEKEK